MEYSKIIEPYLIDFDKLEVWQTLWSVTSGEVEIQSLNNWINLTNGFKYYRSGINSPLRDKYPTLFTSNPFENLQLVEPLEFEEKPDEEPFTVDPETIEQIKCIFEKAKKKI